MDPELLKILCDPVSKVPLTLMSKTDLKNLNQAISSGAVLTVDNQPVSKPLEAALITDDRKVIYPLEDDIPILLADRGIGTTQLSEFE